MADEIRAMEIRVNDGSRRVPIRNTVTARDIAPVGLRRLIAEEPRVPVAPCGVAADSPGCHG